VKVEVTDKEILETICGHGVNERDFARKAGCSMRRIYDVINEHVILRNGEKFGYIERVPDGE
jgi:hypothetical protein